MLDEPTNHLDLPSQEILQAILADYGGTILLVSHDRYLIDALATQVWEVLPSEYTLRVFEGTYSEYKAARQAEAARAQALAVPPDKYKPEPLRVRSNPTPSKAERQRKQRIQELETEISSLETKLAQISSQLENPPAEPGKVQHLGQEYLKIQNELEKHIEEWSNLQA